MREDTKHGCALSPLFLVSPTQPNHTRCAWSPARPLKTRDTFRREGRLIPPVFSRSSCYLGLCRLLQHEEHPLGGLDMGYSRFWSLGRPRPRQAPADAGEAPCKCPDGGWAAKGVRALSEVPFIGTLTPWRQLRPHDLITSLRPHLQIPPPPGPGCSKHLAEGTHVGSVGGVSRAAWVLQSGRAGWDLGPVTQ